MVLRTASDENAIEKTRRLQQAKLGGQIVETKRAALGELGNGNRITRAVTALKDATNNVVKGVNVNNAITTLTASVIAAATVAPPANVVTEKKKEIVSTKKSKHVINLKNVKPRVDTHWQKSDAKKIKRDAIKVTTIVTGNVKPTIKTIAAKANNNNNSNNANNNNNGKQSGNLSELNKAVAVLRREESNLGRRSSSRIASKTRKLNDKANITHQSNEQLNKIPVLKKVNSISIPKRRVTSGSQAEDENVAFSTHQINQVRNIDLDDEYNLYAVPEYTNDIYLYLMTLEDENPINDKHLMGQTEITPKMRAILFDWLTEVSHQFHLLIETFFMSIGIVDRYLQKVQTTVKQELQLVGVSALLIAAKYEELYPPEVADLSYITDNAYSSDEIIKMEQTILKVLEFNLSPPSPIHFLRRFSKAVDTTRLIYHQAARYFIELSVIEYSFACVKPSQMAAASLYLSLILFDEKDLLKLSDCEKLWTPTLQFYTKYKVKELEPIVKKLAKIVFGVQTSKFKAAYNKYKSEKFEQVADKPQLLNGFKLIKLFTDDNDEN